MIQTLVDKYQTADRYKVAFSGKHLASGIYFLRLITSGDTGAGSTLLRRMLLLK